MKNRYSFATILKYCCGVSPTVQSIYYTSQHHHTPKLDWLTVSANPLWTQQTLKPSSDRLEHGEARQYCSTLVRCLSMLDSIEPSHLVVKATADVILNPEGHMTPNNNTRYRPKTDSTSSFQERTRNRQHLGRMRRSGPRLVMVVPHL